MPRKKTTAKIGIPRIPPGRRTRRRISGLSKRI